MDPEADLSFHALEKLADLNRLVVDMVMAHDRATLYPRLTKSLCEMLQADGCTIAVTDSGDNQLRALSSNTFDEGERISPEDYPWLYHVLETGESYRSIQIGSAVAVAKAPAFAGPQPEYSHLIVPIQSRNQVYGTMEVINEQNSPFSKTDQFVLETVAAHIANSFRRAQLASASKDRLEELSLLLDISETVSSLQDKSEIMRSTGNALIHHMNAEVFRVFEWDQEKGRWRSERSDADLSQQRAGSERQSLLAGPFPTSILSIEQQIDQYVWISSDTQDSTAIETLRKIGFEAVIITPLVARKKMVGVAELYFAHPPLESDKYLRVMKGVSGLLATAFENIVLRDSLRLHAAQLEIRVADRTVELEALYQQQTLLAESERKARELAETLREAGAVVAESLELNTAISRILSQLARVIPHDSASVQLFRDGYLEIVGGGGWADQKTFPGYRFPIPGENPNTVVAQTRRPVVLQKKDLDQFQEFKLKMHGDIRSWLGVPLIAHGELIGMLTLDSYTDGYFEDHHAETVAGFADQVAVAIEQAMLFEKTTNALQIREALRDVIAEITDQRELATLLQSTLVRACGLLDASSGELALYREETEALEIVAEHNMGRKFTGTHIHTGKGAIGIAAKTRKAIRIDDYSQWEHALPMYRDNNPWRAVMSVPLTYQGRLIGVIAIADKRDDKRFTNMDLELLEMFAHQVAIAIVNTELFEQVQRLATIDELTGIPNRRELFRLGNDLFEQVANGKRPPLTVLMLDIDLFKIINDGFGHSIGDQVLSGLMQIVSSQIRESDVITRYGGEEFVVLLPDTDYAEACSIAERLREAVARQPIMTDRGPVAATVSIGVATQTPRHAGLAALIDDADAAMYLAKHKGRNRVEGLPPSN